MRIGMGYDVHRLVAGRKLVLGGVTVPYEKGLLGHSDADVLVHAVMDALLGALGKGDIGRMFPDSSAAFKDISSLTLLERVADVMTAEGYATGNIDCCIVAQEPKLAPYIEDMARNIERCCRAAVGTVNVKATTEEGLGFTGCGDGMAAHAVCLLRKGDSSPL